MEGRCVCIMTEGSDQTPLCYQTPLSPLSPRPDQEQHTRQYSPSSHHPIIPFKGIQGTEQMQRQWQWQWRYPSVIVSIVPPSIHPCIVHPSISSMVIGHRIDSRCHRLHRTYLLWYIDRLDDAVIAPSCIHLFHRR